MDVLPPVVWLYLFLPRYGCSSGFDKAEITTENNNQKNKKLSDSGK